VNLRLERLSRFQADAGRLRVARNGIDALYATRLRSELKVGR
jgi:hypothetical protein